MSAASLPDYTAIPATAYHLPTPEYSAEPRPHERRIELATQERRANFRPRADFSRQSKGGNVTLRLTGQEESASLPVYGYNGSVRGHVDFSRTEGILSVEIRIDGLLELKEIAEGGTTSSTLCSDKAVLWTRGSSSGSCPLSLSFHLQLPTTYSDPKGSYPLPPTYEVHLSGIPGFRASTSYSISVFVYKTKSTLFGLGNTTISTPFIYRPRTRPPAPHPTPLRLALRVFSETQEWRSFDSTIESRSPGGKDILVKLYLPSSRIFCLTERIPFHLTLVSSARSLATFLPSGPTATFVSSPGRTRIELVRQSACDVRNVTHADAKTEIWKSDRIGEGSFRRAGDGPDWVAYSGEIDIKYQVTVAGFKASGLFVKDCVLLSMMPRDPQRAPFGELRQSVPVRLTTDPWSADGSQLPDNNYDDSQYSATSSADDYMEIPPNLNYRAIS